MNTAYLTIEDDIGVSELSKIPDMIIDAFDNLDIDITENNDYCFVLKIIYDDFDEIQELVSTASYLLLGANINRYTTTVNSTEFL